MIPRRQFGVDGHWTRKIGAGLISLQRNPISKLSACRIALSAEWMMGSRTASRESDCSKVFLVLTRKNVDLSMYCRYVEETRTAVFELFESKVHVVSIIYSMSTQAKRS